MRALMTLMTLTAMALVLFALPAATDAQTLSLTLNAGQQYNYDDSFDGISVDDRADYGNYALGVEVIPNLTISAEYEYDEEVDPLLGMDMDFDVHAALISVQYAYPLTGWFSPHVRVGGGAYWGDIELAGTGVNYGASDFGFGFYALGGFDLTWHLGDPGDPKSNFFDHLTFALTNDYGWMHRPTLSFDNLQPVNGDGPEIDMGEVDLQGWTWRAGLSVRYTL